MSNDLKTVQITNTQATMVLGMLTHYSGSSNHDDVAAYFASRPSGSPVELTPVACHLCADTVETFLYELDGPDAEYVRPIRDAFVQALERRPPIRVAGGGKVGPFESPHQK